MDSAEENRFSPARWRVQRRLREIIETVQWLLIALILALFFRAFIMEAYRIPTGSMAATLKGAHFRLCCKQCGYRFDRGYDSSDYGLPKYALPSSGKETPRSCRCPVCGYDLKFNKPVWVTNGDRILVLKCKYQFVEPNRWDVIVFKEPDDPRNNMIKRLVGKPGETVQIIDGDIYIDGMIAAKPPRLQEELWIPVYDSDYHPVRPQEESFGGSGWQVPWRGLDDSWWGIDANNVTSFELNSAGGQLCELVYDSSKGSQLKASYAYNGQDFQQYRHYCSDLKVRFLARAQGELYAGAQLSKYGRSYRGWVEGGMMYIGRVVEGQVERFAEKQLKQSQCSEAVIAFSNVDHILTFQYGNDSIKYNLGPVPKDAGEIIPGIEPTVRILASEKVRVSHLAIFRDIHYTSGHFYGNEGLARAAQGNGFTLKKDEYFVLGDNSPNSHDGRWWDKPGIGNNGSMYRVGIVPRDYLVGKAVFVYWPGGFRLFEESRVAIIPNFGQMRFIHGGSGRQQ